jgi:uncharacterized membrane protein
MIDKHEEGHEIILGYGMFKLLHTMRQFMLIFSMASVIMLLVGFVYWNGNPVAKNGFLFQSYFSLSNLA